MSTKLHAFSLYTVNEEDEIIYENDKGFDIAYGNWHYFHTALQYAKYLTGLELDVPVYDYIEDGPDVKKDGMNLIKPEKFIGGLEAVLTGLRQLPGKDNLLIDDSEDWFLFDINKDESFQRQKEKLFHYTEMLLKFAQEGLYFVVERE